MVRDVEIVRDEHPTYEHTITFLNSVYDLIVRYDTFRLDLLVFIYAFNILVGIR